MGTHLRVLSESFPMNTNRVWIILQDLCVLVLRMKAALALEGLTLPMLRLLSSKAQESKDFLKSSKPCHVDIHLIALGEYSQMNTHLPGFGHLS